MVIVQDKTDPAVKMACTSR